MGNIIKKFLLGGYSKRSYREVRKKVLQEELELEKSPRRIKKKRNETRKKNVGKELGS